MTASKDFQEHLQAGQISEAIALVVGQLVELDVTTNLAATDATPQTSLRTQISLATGKITTEVNPELLNRESAQQLLDFHTAQIKATNAVVRDHLHSLRELLQILQGHAPLVATSVIDPQPDVALPMTLTPAVINSDIEYPVAVPEPATALPTTEPPIIDPVPSGALKTGTGFAAGGMAAAVAQAGSPKFDEADSIPNKFEQVLKSAGVKEETGNHPFTPPSPVVVTTPEIPPTVVNNNDADLESDPEWDEWLLEEDAILSELSLASEEVAKDKIPDWDEQWFAQPAAKKNEAEDWEKFIPEYVDLDAPAHRGQANVERFRQNLVNDPQLMSELLAELDDIEKLNQDEFPKP